MKTVTLDVRSPEVAMAETLAAAKSGKPQKTARISFAIKAVHSDVTALLLAGVLDRTASGQVEFPYDAVKVEFLLEAA